MEDVENYRVYSMKAAGNYCAGIQDVVITICRIIAFDRLNYYGIFVL